MHIMVLHQYYLDDQQIGGSRFNQFVKYWTEMGHEVTVVAGMLNNKTGEKYEKYKGKVFAKEEKKDNLTVIRAHVSQAYNKSFIGRLWGYFSFTFFSTLASFGVKKPDVILVTSPPLSVGMTGVIASKFKRTPLVFEVRDLWPESAIDTGVLTNKYLIKFSYWLENFSYKNAKKINALTPAFVEKISTEKNVDKEDIWMIPNGADLDIFEPGEKNNWVRKEYGLDNKFVVTYIGAHGVANNLITLINTAKKLKDNQEIVFMLVGGGMQKDMLKEKAEEYNLDNIIFIDPQPKTKVVDYVNAADIGTAVLQKNDTFKTVYPNKVFDYMSCAKPILLAIDGVARELVVEKAASGFYIEPENPDEFADKILEVYNQKEKLKEMGQRGYEYVKENFSRKALAEKYIEKLTNL